MELKHALVALYLSFLTMQLCACAQGVVSGSKTQGIVSSTKSGRITITTVEPEQKGVVDARSASKFPKFLKECDFAKGDSLEKVKQFYQIDSDPQPFKYQGKYKGATAYSYHFDQYGVWVFFDTEMKVRNLRFSRPFAGGVAGITIGDSTKQLVKLNGNPTKKFAHGLYDYDELRKRNEEITSLLESLPDPAPKAMVFRVFDKVQKISTQAPVRTEAWRYESDSTEFVNYYISPVDNRVKHMLTGSCTTRLKTVI